MLATEEHMPPDPARQTPVRPDSAPEDSAQDPQGPVILELRNISYCYEGAAQPVLQDFSAQWQEGEICAISGPSGCGKSTLLQLIDGLIPHVYEGSLAGAVLYKGVDISCRPPAWRSGHIGLVMQNPESQFCTFTVAEELAFGLENLAVDPAEMDRRIDQALASAQLGRLKHAPLETLSGGQKQLVALLSVLITRPRILLLDEPTANLDSRSRRQVLDLIAASARTDGSTVLLIEHNVADAAAHLDRLMVLDSQGRLTYNGPAGSPWAQAWLAHSRDYQAALAAPVKGCPPERAASEELLCLEDVHFSYPGQTGPGVLRGVDLSLRSHELVALVGDNGAGKTTLTRLLFKMHAPDQGRIRLCGKDLCRLRPAQVFRQMGLVFQDPELQFVRNSVWAEALLALKNIPLSGQEKQARAWQMLKRYDLLAQRDQSPFALSQGQKRRLSVAVMLPAGQRLLFLDEPTYGQDFERRVALMQNMVELVSTGMTVVLITHDLELACHCATRLIALEEGRVGFDGAPEDYLRQKEC